MLASDFDVFSVFELDKGIINDGCEPQNCFYAAVISSRGYPVVSDESVTYVSIINIPVSTYITYTLLTPPETSFPNNQIVQIYDIDSFEFKRSLYFPRSDMHSMDQSIDVISYPKGGDSPQFLIKYAG